MAKSLCLQLGLSGVKLDECIFDVAVTNDSSLAEQETFQIGRDVLREVKRRECSNSMSVLQAVQPNVLGKVVVSTIVVSVYPGGLEMTVAEVAITICRLYRV